MWSACFVLGRLERIGSPPVKYLAMCLRIFYVFPAWRYGCANGAIGALMAVSTMEISHRCVKKHGNYGIGTVNGLDGEMIALDGIFYQIRSDGHVYLLETTIKTPYAAVTFFQPEVTYFHSDNMTLDELHAALHDMNPTRNFIYAFKIEGSFFM
jgi:alpha-acetolactate decarboxylase